MSATAYSTEIAHQALVWQAGMDIVLKRHKIAYGIADAVRGPQVFTFRLGLADVSTLPRLLGLREQIAMRMDAASVRIARRYGCIDIEVPLPSAFVTQLSPRKLRQKGGAWIALGKTSTGRTVQVNLSKPSTAHVLIAGQTGSGKTFTEWLIAWSIAAGNKGRDSVRMLLIDGRKRGVRWRGFVREAHLAHPVIGETNEAMRALAWLLKELDLRAETARATPVIYVIVDEVYALLEAGGAAAAGALAEIASVGREFGIHLILATQHPLADAIGGAIAKANLPLRLCGKVRDANAAYIATGVKATGAEGLAGEGDFILTAGSGVYRLQIAKITQRDIYALPRVENERHLELDDVDLDRVLGVITKKPGRAPAPIDPGHVAHALVTGAGIDKLRRSLKIGQPKASAARRFALRLLEELKTRGHAIYPILEKGHGIASGTTRGVVQI